MLTRVDVQSENPFYLQIRDARPTDSIIVEKIEGLDPPDIDLFVGDYARDGGFYSGRRVPPRHPVLTLSLNPNYKENESASGLRKLLYRAFVDPFDGIDSVSLILHDDEIADRYITGNTEKFECDIFSDDPVATISMTCPNPYLLDVALTSIPAVGPQLSFPYLGSAETGFELYVTILINTSVLKINLNGRIMVITFDFQAGDVFYINTNRGSRKLTMTRVISSVPTTIDILYALTTTTWVDIHAESNVMKVYGALTTNLIAKMTQLNFRGMHWGI